MDQDEVVRDLNRLVNEPKIEQRHRNYARNAVTFIREQEDQILELKRELEDAQSGRLPVADYEEDEQPKKPSPTCDNCGYCVLHTDHLEASKYVHCSKKGLRMLTLNRETTLVSEQAVRNVIREKCAEYSEGCEYFVPIRKHYGN